MASRVDSRVINPNNYTSESSKLPEFDVSAAQRALAPEINKLALGWGGLIRTGVGGVINGVINNRPNNAPDAFSKTFPKFPNEVAEIGKLLPEGNTEAFPIGKDDNGEYSVARTQTGFEITLRSKDGTTYALNVDKRGRVENATYTDTDGNSKPFSEKSAEKMITTALSLSRKAFQAPELK